MRISELKQLKPGDRVRWNDPDDGLCSKDLTIKAISVYASNEAFIESECGSEIECYARELQALPPLKPPPGIWLNDEVQFARLICGMTDAWEDEDQAKRGVNAIAYRLGLSPDEVNNLIDRAEATWERTKRELYGPKLELGLDADTRGNLERFLRKSDSRK